MKVDTPRCNQGYPTPLNLHAIKNAAPRERDYKLFDEKGLFLLVKTSGAKYWRLKYRFGGKEKLLALGTLSDVTLTQARARRDDARTLLRDGVDPAEANKAKKQSHAGTASDSFEAVTREWLERRGKMFESGDERLVRLFERDLFPALGRANVGEISSPQLLDVLRRIEAPENRGEGRCGDRASRKVSVRAGIPLRDSRWQSDSRSERTALPSFSHSESGRLLSDH